MSSSSSISLSSYEDESFDKSATKTGSDIPSKELWFSLQNFNHTELSQGQTTLHSYPALTTEVITQHEHHHSNTTHDVENVNTESSFPYTRFSSYKPLIEQGTSVPKLGADHQQQVNTPPSNTTSYASTPSYDTTPSYNSTIPHTYEYNNTPSSIQAEPELESYSSAHTSYWRPEEFSQSLDTGRYDIAYAGAQFDVDGEVPVMETGNV